MYQFAELRHNTVLMPGKKANEAPVVFDELIFISAQRAYEMDATYTAVQKVETLVSRMLCDTAGKTNIICNLSELLPAGHSLKAVVMAWIRAEVLAIEKKEKAEHSLFTK